MSSNPLKASSPLMYVSTIKPSDSNAKDTEVRIFDSSSTNAIRVIYNYYNYYEFMANLSLI